MALGDTPEGRSLARAFRDHPGSLAVLREPDLNARLAAWIVQQGIAPAESAPEVAARTAEALGEDKAAAWLADGGGCSQLRDVAVGMAGLCALTDAELAVLNYLEGNDAKPAGRRRRGRR